jgi:hypothetical protein
MLDCAVDGEAPVVMGDLGMLAEIEHRPIPDSMLTGRQTLLSGRAVQPVRKRPSSAQGRLVRVSLVSRLLWSEDMDHSLAHAPALARSSSSASRPAPANDLERALSSSLVSATKAAVRRARCPASQPMTARTSIWLAARLLQRAPDGLDVVDRGTTETARARKYPGKGHLLCGRQPPCLAIALGRNDVDARHCVGLAELLGRLEAAPINVERVQELLRREVRGEGIGQPQLGGEMSAERAGSENPQRHLDSRRRHRLQALPRRLQLQHVLRKIVGVSSERRSARTAIWSVPGARPRPRSPGSTRRLTLGADKAYDAAGFVAELRGMCVTPHVAQNTSGRSSAIDGRTTRHKGYALSQRCQSARDLHP